MADLVVLNVTVRVAARSFSCQQLCDFYLTDESCLLSLFHSSSFHKIIVMTAIKLFWILLTDDWACLIWMRFYKLQSGLHIVSSSVIFCRQIEVCMFFIPHKTSWQLANTSEGNDWWLMMLCLDEVTQAATRSWLQAIWWHWLSDKLCLPSCKNSSQSSQGSQAQVVKVVRLRSQGSQAQVFRVVRLK